MDIAPQPVEPGPSEPDRPESLPLHDNLTVGFSQPPSTHRAGVPLLVVALIAALLGGAYYYRATRAPVTSPAEAVTSPPTEVPAPAAPPAQAGRLGGSVEPVAFPPLDQSDSAVGALVKALSSHPRVAAWLTTRGLVRNFVVVVDNIARGKAPAMFLTVLRPAAPFRVAERGGAIKVDDRSYQRYDDLAGAVAAINPAGAARLYATVRPLVDEAYRELGYPDAAFDATLERAIVSLLEAPVPGPAVELRRAPKGVTYLFADPRLEGLTGAQKQLIRMGPSNMRRVQTSLRAMALALGIPSTRLPPEHD